MKNNFITTFFEPLSQKASLLGKYFILYFGGMIAVASCNNTPKEKENPNLLSTSLVNNPRSALGTDTAVLNALANMSFKDTVYDFGTIKQGEVVSHEYDFTNTGKSPLLISNAAGSCGCTVADFPREPVQPGKTGTIKVQFSSAGKEGHQEKSVTLTTNSTRGLHILFIKGEVK
ncbi:MAG: DUF1573 domain-containing protein [Bacteroidetes bacterium]|nr:DUF1573 domain-containing protein [Bacteroidota bacterium]